MINIIIYIVETTKQLFPLIILFFIVYIVFFFLPALLSLNSLCYLIIRFIRADHVEGFYLVPKNKSEK